MTWFAIIIVCISAVLHAVWNLISKKSNPTAAFFAVAMCFGAVLTSPFLIYFAEYYAHFSADIWWGVLLTGIWQTIYFFSLAAAYRHGDISVAYPLARSSPLIVVTISAVLLGNGHLISWLCIAGTVIIVGGSFLLPMKHLKDFAVKNYWNKMAAYALLAACGTALYSMTDDYVLRSMATLHMGLTPLELTLMYIGLQAVSVAASSTLAVCLLRNQRQQFRHILCQQKRAPLFVAFSSYLTYILVLLAYQHSSEVSYVVAFRQLSIPLGAVLGVWVLKESASTPKFLGVAIIVVGLILVAMG